MTDQPPIERACYWLSLRLPEPAPALVGSQTADIVVIGAGLTGLWTASFLKQLDPTREIVVVEQASSAYGASGRNAGILGDTLDHSHSLAIAHFGRDEAVRLAQLGRQNMDDLRAHLVERDIDCDLEPVGGLTLAHSEEHARSLVETRELACSIGVEDLRLLSREETFAEIHSPLFHAALFNPRAAILDPVKLVSGLAHDLTSRGVRLFEQTKVLGIEARGAGVAVRTENGEITAQKAILATNAWSHELLPRLRFRFLPLYDYVLVSERLTAEQRELIGWRSRQAATDSRNFFNYYRLTRDDRILWGTSEAKYYPGNRVDPRQDHSEEHYRELRLSFARHFPALEGLSFPYAWGGPICATTRFTPFFGAALGGRVHYGLGYTGHGLGSTHLAGRILAHMALDRPSELLDLGLVREQPFPYPPEPFRGWAVSAVTRGLRRVDEGHAPGPLLRLLDKMGIGLSS